MDEAKLHGKMFCRLCLISTNDYQPLEGVLHDMLEAILMNTCLRATENPIICSTCEQKIQKAFQFKSTCVNTEVTLTHFTPPQQDSKVDLKMVYWIEKGTCELTQYEEDLKICRICVDLIKNNEYASLLDTVEFNELEDMFKIYIPELTLNLTENPLICEKCIENFRTFSAFISTSLDTETKIKSYCEEKKTEDDDQVDLEKIVPSANTVVQKPEDKKDFNIMKLFKNENLLCDLYGDSDMELNDHLNGVEENERKIMKLIIEEDVDSFYKDRPDFDGHDVDCEETDVEIFNPFPKLSSTWDLSSSFEDSPKHDQIPELESPQPSSSEENSLSPEPTFKKCLDCRLRSPEKNGRCFGCEEKNYDSEDSKEEWKKEYPSLNSTKISSTKKAKKEGRKCRKVYGVEYKGLWCTQCRWKKACTRFSNRSVTRR
ncbi:uncharacterized protein [Leptinotarsa decemlineata]|uniref:uncharacterized protein n=1 Tax=Leptinotarsa decemlineata TaxID=7539 RepID=UPI003D3070B4